jgi:hypothetical protein
MKSNTTAEALDHEVPCPESDGAVVGMAYPLNRSVPALHEFASAVPM